MERKQNPALKKAQKDLKRIANIKKSIKLKKLFLKLSKLLNEY